jgi:hypothetical protein
MFMASADGNADGGIGGGDGIAIDRALDMFHHFIGTGGGIKCDARGHPTRLIDQSATEAHAADFKNNVLCRHLNPQILDFRF